MDFYVAIRSFKRAGSVRTHKLFNDWHLWVCEREYNSYAKIYGADNVVAVPNEWDGHPGRKKNYILDNAPSERIVICDDDISSFGYYEGGARLYQTPETLHDFIVHGFEMAEQFGVKLWGMNQGKDSMHYRTQHPFAMLSPILDPFTGHIKPVLRNDERFLLKSDYDFWLQNIQKYHKTLRFNKYHYLCDHGTLAGGCVSLRTLEKEQQYAYLLQRKWGSGIVRMKSSKGGKSATGNNVLNIKIHIPIGGM